MYHKVNYGFSLSKNEVCWAGIDRKQIVAEHAELVFSIL